MSTAAQTIRNERLERIIEESISEVNALEQALRQERRALESRDATALGIAAEEKHARVAALEALEAKRTVLLSGGTSEGSPASHLHGNTAAQERWQYFLSVVSRCSSLNMTNGAIIRLRRQQISDTLRVVSGSAAETYGPSGAESSSRPRRALAAI
jgi:flagellar biosynthesis/type III secretory pathway chaperone